MKEVKFTCPKCGLHFLEEVLNHAIVYTKISDISIKDEENIANCEYSNSDPVIEDGEVDAYQCYWCGFRLTINGDNVNDLEGLALWFRQHPEMIVPEN